MLFGLMIFEGKVNCDLFFCEKCNVFFEDGKICCWNFLNIVLFRRVFILKKRYIKNYMIMVFFGRLYKDYKELK